jgi:hypothetical protein
MKDLPLSVYDFFGYLANGLILLFLVAIAFDLRLASIHELNSIEITAVVVIAYSVGHVVAYLAGVGIEYYFVGGLLGRTEATLLGLEAIKLTACEVNGNIVTGCHVEYDLLGSQLVEVADAKTMLRTCPVMRCRQRNDNAALLITTNPRLSALRRCQIKTQLAAYRTRWLRQNVFNHFFEPLSASILVPVRERAKREGVDAIRVYGRAAAAPKSDSTRTRMNTFLYLYGATRNICMACLIGAAGLMVSAVASPARHVRNVKLILAILSFFTAVIMLFRYLDFYRRYNLEVYKSYAFPQTFKA